MSGRPKLETTRKELTKEAKDYINDTCKKIILDAIPREELDNYLYSITVTTDDKTQNYNAAILYLFGIPRELNKFLAVNTLRIDLETQKITNLPVFFAPAIIRNDETGNPIDAVIIGRYGDISVTEAYITSSIAPESEIEDYYYNKSVSQEEPQEEK